LLLLTCSGRVGYPLLPEYFTLTKHSKYSNRCFLP
jgi:hypothetical protein